MNKKIIYIIISILIILLIMLIIFLHIQTKKDNVNTSNTIISNNENENIENTIISNNKNENTINNTEIKNSSEEIEGEDLKDYKKLKLNLIVNGKTMTATLESNSSVDALIDKLSEGDITVNLNDYANFEKVGALGFSLPRNDKSITTNFGDIILYQGNQLVIYYDTNSWSFTKLGHIDNISQSELKEILGTEDVTVTLSIN